MSTVDFASETFRSITKRPDLLGSLPNPAFQIMLEQFAFQPGDRRFKRPAGIYSLALLSVIINQGSHGALHLLTQFGDFSYAPQKLIVRVY